MPTAFQYVPVSGALSGASFEEQTERAINEIGSTIDGAYAIAEEALEISESAQAASSDALITAQNAITAAQHAETSAEVAQSTATQALTVAEEAAESVDEAVQAAALATDVANGARQTADNAQATAEDAGETAQHAEIVSASAETLARAAMNMQSGGFEVRESAVNANTQVSAERIYATTAISNVPSSVTAPAYFTAMPTNDQTHVTQEVWAEASPTSFLRTGSVAWSPAPGTDTYNLNAVPLEGATVPGTLTASHNGTTLNVGFTPGGFSGAQTTPFESEGVVSFTLGTNFLGVVTLTMSGAEIVRVSADNVVVVVGEIKLARSTLVIANAEYSGDTLSLTVRVAWTDKTYSATWGNWTTVTVPIATTADNGICRPDGTHLTVDAGGSLTTRTRGTSVATLTSSGNWTVPYSGYYLIEAQGGGGGSGGIWASGCCLASGGGGGGGYQTAVKYYAAGAVIPYTIGARGDRGVFSSAGGGIWVGSATDGGATTFDGTTALGGRGSYGISYNSTDAFNGLYPGVASIAVKGGSQGGNAEYRHYNRGLAYTSAWGGLSSGAGGNSPFGAGGNFAAVSANATAQSSEGDTPLAGNYGAGAGGAIANYSSANGGYGVQGCVRISFLGV